jgi:hypothetical protein
MKCSHVSRVRGDQPFTNVSAPPTIVRRGVIARMSLVGQVKMSRSRATKSASMPGAIVPRVPSKRIAKVAPVVERRVASSRVSDAAHSSHCSSASRTAYSTPAIVKRNSVGTTHRPTSLTVIRLSAISTSFPHRVMANVSREPDKRRLMT